MKTYGVDIAIEFMPKIPVRHFYLIPAVLCAVQPDGLLKVIGPANPSHSYKTIFKPEDLN